MMAVRGRWRWTCVARCNLHVYDPGYTGTQQRVSGRGWGNSEDEACLDAQKAAKRKAPRGTYPRHCHCRCERK
jgi:hypothetical protein